MTNAVEFLVDSSKPSLILSFNIFNHSMYLALNLVLFISNTLFTFSKFVIIPLKNLRSNSGSSFRRIICSSSQKTIQYPLILGLALLPFCLPLRNTPHDKPIALFVNDGRHFQFFITDIQLISKTIFHSLYFVFIPFLDGEHASSTLLPIHLSLSFCLLQILLAIPCLCSH